MAKNIYYRDGEKEEGPFTEKDVLNEYNRAVFTSDVTFQFRTSPDAPYTRLSELISKNGPINPFRDCANLSKRIEEAEKELEKFRSISSKKVELEKKVAEIEKKVEERMNEKEKGEFPKDVPNEKGSSNSGEKTAEDFQRGMKYLEEKYGAKVERFSMDNETHAKVYRDSLHHQIEQEPGWVCMSCHLMAANWKQFLLHINHSCPYGVPKELKDKFEADIPRWKEEDAARLSMGRRLYSKMSAEEKGKARPQTDFVEDINMKLKNYMKLNTDEGTERTSKFLKTDEAAKIKDRVEKHLKDAKGLLVCNTCKVACKTPTHFIIHLITYDHRFKVKGTPFELISLVLGWFNRSLYLTNPEESEINENVKPMEGREFLPTMSGVVWTKPEEEEEEEMGGCDSDCDCHGVQDDMMTMMTKAQTIGDLSQRTIISCTECDAMYTNFKQFLVHVGSDQHVASVGRVDQSREEREADRRGHEEFLGMFQSDLQKWRWADRGSLSSGKKVFAGWNEEEKKEARPKKEFIEALNIELGRTIKKMGNGKYGTYFTVAERYFVSNQAKNMMDGMEKHLKDAKKFVCVQCEFGCKDANSFYLHCMTYDHVRVTQGSLYELPTILIGVHKKSLTV